MTDQTLLTDKERKLINKLETEMFYALTINQIRFYKNEIQTIINHAKRRNLLVNEHKSILNV
ncbi:hypothetical protein FS935_07450 [Metabacillus litoralis]|uniref:Uncharacterized protein n=1 Tax=Metabacillus litoralis TaxID=152268 RepID=A0A5C6W190_9BACI|nr:hypothetical protein [Metabacillus litoralis]TXC91469.1 hypothetical protein FS935_07450 [Metabacillus litoralis]